jgi:hypothetical protein
MAMNELAWLVGHRFQLFTRREYDWVVAFDNDASIVVTCLWRLVESDRVRITSEDDGQKAGLPEPVEAAVEVNRRLTGAAVEAIELRSGLLDLERNSDSAPDTRFRSLLILLGMKRGTCVAGTGSSLQLAAANWQSSAARLTPAAANQRLKLSGTAILLFRVAASL